MSTNVVSTTALVCGMRFESPTHIYGFLPQKLAYLSVFGCLFEIFANRDPFLRVFLPQTRLILQVFHNFCEMGPSSNNIFLPKWNPCLRIFGEKVTHLGGTSPYALTCEYPPLVYIITFTVFQHHFNISDFVHSIAVLGMFNLHILHLCMLLCACIP